MSKRYTASVRSQSIPYRDCPLIGSFLSLCSEKLSMSLALGSHFPSSLYQLSYTHKSLPKSNINRYKWKTPVRLCDSTLISRGSIAVLPSGRLQGRPFDHLIVLSQSPAYYAIAKESEMNPNQQFDHHCLLL
jgi:hypothetical protein